MFYFGRNLVESSQFWTAGHGNLTFGNNMPKNIRIDVKKFTIHGIWHKNLIQIG